MYAWQEIVEDGLEDLVESEEFQEADPEKQARMLQGLYAYAGEVGKAEAVKDYEITARADRIERLMDEGLSVSEAVVLESSMSDGLVEDYIEYVQGGMDHEDAAAVTQEIDELEPLEGEDKVVNVQRWRVCVEFSDNEGIQLAALAGQMSESQFSKCQTAYDFDVTPDKFVEYYEIREQFDANGNGSYSNAEIEAAIDSMDGLDRKQKAVLWQLMTGSKSAKNNPYDTRTGQRVLDARG